MARGNHFNGFGGGANMQQLMRQAQKLQEQMTKGRNQPFAAALSAVLLILTMLMINLYKKVAGSSELEGLV